MMCCSTFSISAVVSLVGFASVDDVVVRGMTWSLDLGRIDTIVINGAVVIASEVSGHDVDA